MHDGMQQDPIQGQGHEPFRVGNPFSKAIRAGNWPQILKQGHNILMLSGRIFYIFPSFFVSHDFELGRSVSCEESTVIPVWG